MFLDGRCIMLVGDVLKMLRKLPSDYYDCVPVSPPYWGLRDYGTGRWEGGDVDCDHVSHEIRTGLGMSALGEKYRGGGKKASLPKPIRFRGVCGKCGADQIDDQIGLERTLGQHLRVMVRVFREIRRVLKPGGVVWLNYGDCYATAPNGRSAADTKSTGNDDRTFRDKPFSTVGPVSQEDNSERNSSRRGRSGNLGKGGRNGVGIPNGRVTSGGYLKPKDLCMVPQRLAIALQGDGWWVRSILPWVKRNAMPESIRDRPANAVEYVIMLTKSERYAYDADAVKVAASPATNARVAQNVAAQAGSTRANGGTRANRPMKAVVSGPRVKALTDFSDHNVAVLNDRNFRNTDLFFSSIGTPMGLISGSDGMPLAIDVMPEGFEFAHFATFPVALIEPLLRAGCPAGGRVLDPFAGAGTTGLVAASMGAECTLIDLNAEYAVMAQSRIEAAFMGNDEGKRHMIKTMGLAKDAGPLFEGMT